MFVIVPNYVSDAINAKIDDFLAEYPEATHAREEMYDAMLEAFNVHGVIADITRPTTLAPDGLCRECGIALRESDLEDGECIEHKYARQ